MVVVSGDQWEFVKPVNLAASVDYALWDNVRNVLSQIPVNSITFYTVGRIGRDGVALDPDLIAIANLTGTNTIYYRSAPDTWSPVIIGSGITFLSGTLSSNVLNIGVINGLLRSTGDGSVIQAIEGTHYYGPGGTDVAVSDGGTSSSTASGARSNLGLNIGSDIQAYNANLTSISSLTGNNKIYYQSGVGSWTDITVGSGLNFTSGILTVSGGSGVQGPQGPTGPTGLSGVSFVWKGDWSNSVNYTTYDTVYYTGAGWISVITNNSGYTPSGNSVYWDLMVSGSQGISGTIGSQGLVGPTGATGPQGVQGNTGPSGIGFYWRGLWNTGISYIGNESVYYNGSSWISITGTNLNRTPDISSLYWSLIALSGVQGIQGPSGASGSSSGVGPDLTSIEALTGSGVIYYRSGDGVWSPIIISTGLSFANSILMATGTGGALDADLNAIAALTGTNTIYYRSAVNTWSPVIIGDGVLFTGGMLRAIRDTYCLEDDIGCVPYDQTKATLNSDQLGGALSAMCPTGQFAFVNGTIGPIQKDISCPGKTYYFNRNLNTTVWNGGGLRGVGGGGAAVGDGEVGNGGNVGAVTRFVRMGATGGMGEFVFLLKNNGFKLEGIDFFGGLSPSNINSFTGTKIHTILGIEARTQPPVGEHRIKDCNFTYGKVGVRILSGYYDGGGSYITSGGIHGDDGLWEHVNIKQVDTGVRAENAIAMWHQFDRCYFIINSGGAAIDMHAGGDWKFTSLGLGPTNHTLLQVNQWSPNNSRFDIEFYKDGSSGAANSGFCMFRYIGDLPYSWVEYDARFRGQIDNQSEVTSMSGLAVFNGVTGGNIWFDVQNLKYAPPPTGYQWETVGPWMRLVPSGWS